MSARVEDFGAVERGAGVGRQPPPSLDGRVKILGRERPAAQIVERRLVGRDQPRPAPASIDMLQTVIRSSMLRRRIASPAYSMQ